MSQNDLYHQLVIRALQKSGWRVTQQHLKVEFGTLYVNIDLLVTQVQTEAAIEIKSFANASNIVEFEKAVGQYITYRAFLRANQMAIPLYLAVPQIVYRQFFQEPTIQEIVAESHIHIVTYDVVQEEITQWILN
jgi:Holliday junction resolvase-like predicted endonuclease